MSAKEVNVFLITPRDIDKYSKMLVYADDTEEARMVANVQINPVKIIRPGEKSPIMVDVYSEEAGASCEKIEVEYTLVGSDVVTFEYFDKEYCLAKDFAKAVE